MMRFVLSLFCLSLIANSQAIEAPPMAEDPVLEARLNNLAKELRCLVCQNETLADSHAPLALDLRREVREKMRQGLSDAQIKTYLTQRYGDFVLYRPPVKSATWLLWFGPFILLLGALAGLVYFLQKRRRVLDDTPLSAEDAARLQSLLHAENQPENKQL